MYSIEELAVLRQGLDLLTITGANAKQMVILQEKVENQLEKEIQKREKERQKIDFPQQ
jgi:hypothetical protein